MMPLTITYAELDEGLDILERALDEEFGKEIRSCHQRPTTSPRPSALGAERELIPESETSARPCLRLSR